MRRYRDEQQPELGDAPACSALSGFLQRLSVFLELIGIETIAVGICRLKLAILLRSRLYTFVRQHCAERQQSRRFGCIRLHQAVHRQPRC